MSQRTEPVKSGRGTSGAHRGGRRRRRLRFDAPPPRALALSGWAFLPLRAFLGLTFCFAGLQKLANPNFFNANSPSSIQAQLIASIRISPLHELLGHLLRFAVPIGIMIALAEMAVGLGTIFGLWTRVAAAGGMVLAFTLFLTVSFHSSPYYTGADIVFVFAWLPLVLAGSGGVLSLDGVISAGWRVSTTSGRRPSSPSASPLSSRCAAITRTTPVPRRVDVAATSTAVPSCQATQRGAAPSSREASTRSIAGPSFSGAPRSSPQLSRAVWPAGLGRVVGGAKSPGNQSVSLAPPRPGAAGASGSSPTTTAQGSVAPSTTTPAGTPIGLASQVPVGGSARFTDPKTGDPGLVLQLAKGHFVAYDAICPHAGCTVGYSSAANLIVCPCHGSEFDPSTGAVVNPPAPHGLSSIQVAVDADGELVIDG